MAQHFGDEAVDSATEEDELLASRKPDDKGLVVVLAGKPGSGKSTLFKKIIREQMEIQLSANPVTQIAERHTLVNHGVPVTVVDTPGIIANEAVVEAESNFDILVYCITVSPGAKIVDSNPELMRSLQNMYGKIIWKHCVIVFTFSNLALDRNLKKINSIGKEQCLDEYRKYINSYASECEGVLRDHLKNKNIRVQSIFDRAMPGCPPDENIIMAIPAGDELVDTVLPGVALHQDSKGWKDEIVYEMVKKCKCSEDLVIFMMGRRIKNKILKIAGVIGGSAIGASLAGAGIGAGIGAGVGILAGPIGAAVGTGVGAGVGFVTGAATSGAGVGIYAAVNKSKKNKNKYTPSKEEAHDD